MSDGLRLSKDTGQAHGEEEGYQKMFVHTASNKTRQYKMENKPKWMGGYPVASCGEVDRKRNDS
ncbi:MAG TPA: hypothetical protein VM935_10805 [Chitinophagaceae bacterium]|nr:hypothetical protein [Chitinophagaceae bacterium]